MMQVISTCVVSSFTAHSRHPNKLAMVPTILIDTNQFWVCLYHCEKDVLLISDVKLLATKGHLSRSGLALLWLVMNHRYVGLRPHCCHCSCISSYAPGIYCYRTLCSHVLCLFRLFLQELPTAVTKYPSLIKAHLETSGSLRHFTSLTHNTVNWHSAQPLRKVKNRELPVIYLPPQKKRSLTPHS